MLKKIYCFASTAFALSLSYAAPSNLTTPALYDNVGGGLIWGQTFVSETPLLGGVRWYIGDPTRPGLESVDGLEGSADLVLFSADDLTAPVELARSKIQGAGETISGLFDFQFQQGIETSVGKSYFIGIETSDYFGIGLTPSTFSSYAGGAEARLLGGKIALMSGGRDTSFEIVAAPVPEPSALILSFAGFSAVVVFGKRFRF